jgi:hypothetical protein
MQAISYIFTIPPPLYPIPILSTVTPIFTSLGTSNENKRKKNVYTSNLMTKANPGTEETTGTLNNSVLTLTKVKRNSLLLSVHHMQFKRYILDKLCHTYRQEAVSRMSFAAFAL